MITDNIKMITEDILVITDIIQIITDFISLFPTKISRDFSPNICLPFEDLSSVGVKA